MYIVNFFCCQHLCHPYIKFVWGLKRGLRLSVKCCQLDLFPFLFSFPAQNHLEQKETQRLKFKQKKKMILIIFFDMCKHKNLDVASRTQLWQKQPQHEAAALGGILEDGKSWRNIRQLNRRRWRVTARFVNSSWLVWHLIKRGLHPTETVLNKTSFFLTIWVQLEWYFNLYGALFPVSSETTTEQTTNNSCFTKSVLKCKVLQTSFLTSQRALPSHCCGHGYKTSALLWQV